MALKKLSKDPVLQVFAVFILLLSMLNTREPSINPKDNLNDNLSFFI